VGGTLAFDHSDSITDAGSIGGSDSLMQISSGTLMLDGNNSSFGGVDGGIGNAGSWRTTATPRRISGATSRSTPARCCAATARGNDRDGGGDLAGTDRGGGWCRVGDEGAQFVPIVSGVVFGQPDRQRFHGRPLLSLLTAAQPDELGWVDDIII
jgi:hypothetical protein